MISIPGVLSAGLFVSYTIILDLQRDQGCGWQDPWPLFPGCSLVVAEVGIEPVTGRWKTGSLLLYTLVEDCEGQPLRRQSISWEAEGYYRGARRPRDSKDTCLS